MNKFVTMWVDGSCSGNPGPGGWCAILQYKDHTKTLCGGRFDTTNNQMELTAVLEGLKSIKETCKVTIYSDSKYVVNAVEKGWVDSWRNKNWRKSDGKPAKNQDLWKPIVELLDKHDVTFQWIKAHNGNRFNEEADRIAKLETQKIIEMEMGL